MGEYLNKTSRNGVWGCGPKPQGLVPIFCDNNDPPVSLISGESLTNQGFGHCTRKTRQREVTFGLRGYRLLCGLFKRRYIIPTSAWKDWRKSSQSIQPVTRVRLKLCRLRPHTIKCYQYTKLSNEHTTEKHYQLAGNSGQPQHDPRTARPIKPQY
jgi:hypothetical protein